MFLLRNNYAANVHCYNIQAICIIMKNLILFIDGSVNTKTKIGYGAYLVIDSQHLSMNAPIVKIKRFEHTSSTKLEIQTLLWALNDMKAGDREISVYTDSQNIIGLPARQERLERNNYYSGNGKRLNNYELYQKFYIITDVMNCEFIKVCGHLVARKKDKIDQLFSLVDRASRKALREGARLDE